MVIKPKLYFYQDTAEQKSKDYIDAVLAVIPQIIEKMDHIRAIKKFEIVYKLKAVTKHDPVTNQDFKIGDFLLYWDHIYEIAELKIDGDALSSLNKSHLQAQLQRMLTLNQILQDEAKLKGCEPDKVRAVLLVAFTKEYLDKLGGSEVFTLTKRLYNLKKQFPDIFFIMKSDGQRTVKNVTKIIPAILNCFIGWFEFLFSTVEIKPITVPQLERSVPKGPLFSIAAGVNGWTMEKATYLSEDFETLQDIANARENNLEECLIRHNVSTHNADAINLYEHFRKELNPNAKNPDTDEIKEMAPENNQ